LLIQKNTKFSTYNFLNFSEKELNYLEMEEKKVKDSNYYGQIQLSPEELKALELESKLPPIVLLENREVISKKYMIYSYPAEEGAELVKLMGEEGRFNRFPKIIKEIREKEEMRIITKYYGKRTLNYYLKKGKKYREEEALQIMKEI